MGRAQIGPTTAAIKKQVRDDIAGGIKVHGVQQPRSIAPLRNHARLGKCGEIYGRRAGFKGQRLGDFTCWQRVGIAPHEQTKNRHPLRMTKGRETVSECCFHIS